MRKPRFSGSSRGVPAAGMNLVPLVDLALNLVLILLVTAPAMYLMRLPVKLPEAKTAETNTKEWIRVTFDSEGRLSVNGDIVDSMEALPARLNKERKDLRQDSFLLEVDKAVTYERTSRLLERLRKDFPGSRIAIGTAATYEKPAAH